MHLLLQLELPADARFLPKTRRAVAGYLEDLGAEPELSAEVVLALDEACANVIRHAFPNGTEGTIRLRAEFADDAVIVQVEDDGVGFDPFEVPLRETSVDDVSGRGLRMIRQLMSSVHLESPTRTGGTRLRMAKRLTPEWGRSGLDDVP
jgi:anti-sigma regulatory factor (Ser/Thr protein kinase)